MAKPKNLKAKPKPKVVPKKEPGISINIKNIMRQIQNEPQRDYIRPIKRVPLDSFNTGQMSRLYGPAVTYASNPLQPFYGVSAISNPPATQQLTSLPAVYKSEPIMVETNPYDMAPKPQPAPIEKPRPVVPQQYKQSKIEDWGYIGPKQVPIARIGDYAATAGPQQVSTPINQPNTIPLDEIASMTTRERLRAEGKRMESAADRVATLSKQYPMTFETGSVKRP